MVRIPSRNVPKNLRVLPGEECNTTPRGNSRITTQSWFCHSGVEQMPTTAQRYRDNFRRLFAQFLKRWLSQLPQDGWTGTSKELFYEMESKRRAGDAVPAPNALANEIAALAPLLTEAGFTMRAHRTASARLLVIELANKVE